jgi:hypothetical protein
MGKARFPSCIDRQARKQGRRFLSNRDGNQDTTALRIRGELLFDEEVLYFCNAESIMGKFYIGWQKGSGGGRLLYGGPHSDWSTGGEVKG